VVAFVSVIVVPSLNVNFRLNAVKLERSKPVA
jgi:hypothetical protein